MGLRYVWQKWNAIGTPYYSGAVTEVKLNNLSMGGTIYVNGDPRTVYGVPTEIPADAVISADNRTFYSKDATNVYIDNTDFLNALKLVFTTAVYTTRGTTYSKGSTSYGKISSASSGAYSSNGASGDYWYVLQGSDTIDPASVTYDESTLVAGETVTVTISPSTGNSYGGTITYQVEVNVDETGWEVVTQTTSTSVNLDIPADAVSWRVRVLASDDMGFTSTDYVYGNNAVNDPSTVIYPSVFAVMPEDKNLGYLATSSIVTYLVTTDDGVNYSITITLDDEEISTTTESPKARTLVLSDDIWEGLSSEGVHTLVMTVAQGDEQIVRTFQFRKFVYDYSCLAGLFTGIARATRIKRSFNKQIVAANFPKEILKIASVKEDITPSYIDVTVPYAPGGTVVATSSNGDTYGADLDESGVTRITVDNKGYYTIRGYVGSSPSSSASVTIENDGDTVTAALQWIKLTVTVESGANVVATCGDYSVSGTSSGTADLYLPATGTWTVTATRSSYSFSTSGSVEITAYGNYAIELEFVSSTFGENSWETIQRITQAGKAASYWNVGDQKAVTLNGGPVGTGGDISAQDVFVFILGFNHNSQYEGNNTIHFGIKNSYGNIYSITTTCMHNSTDEVVGWENCYARNTACANFLLRLPDELQNVIIPCTKYSDNVGAAILNADDVTPTQDKIFLFGEREITGEDVELMGHNPGEDTKQMQYDYFINGNEQRMYTSNNAKIITWLRSHYNRQSKSDPTKPFSNSDI